MSKPITILRAYRLKWLIKYWRKIPQKHLPSFVANLFIPHGRAGEKLQPLWTRWKNMALPDAKRTASPPQNKHAPGHPRKALPKSENINRIKEAVKWYKVVTMEHKIPFVLAAHTHTLFEDGERKTLWQAPSCFGGRREIFHGRKSLPNKSLFVDNFVVGRKRTIVAHQLKVYEGRTEHLLLVGFAMCKQSSQKLETE